MAGTASFAVGWLSGGKIDDASTNYLGAPAGVWAYDSFLGMPNGNETLLHSWSSLEGSIRMSIMFAGMDRALRNMDVKRHSDIVDAIESGDAEKAAATVRDHMAGAATVLVYGAA